MILKKTDPRLIFLQRSRSATLVYRACCHCVQYTIDSLLIFRLAPQKEGIFVAVYPQTSKAQIINTNGNWFLNFCLRISSTIECPSNRLAYCLIRYNMINHTNNYYSYLVSINHLLTLKSSAQPWLYLLKNLLINQIYFYQK